MTHKANILSFDEVKAHGAFAPRTVSSRRPSQVQYSSHSTSSSPLHETPRHASRASLGRGHNADMSVESGKRYAYLDHEFVSAFDHTRSSASRSGQTSRVPGGSTSVSGLHTGSYGSMGSSRDRDRHARDVSGGRSDAAYRGRSGSDVRWAQRGDGAFDGRGVRSGRDDGDVRTNRGARDNRDGRDGRHAAPEKMGLFARMKKQARTAKADRMFDRTIGARDAKKAADAQAPSSRAALYEMRMGASQKKSTRMQDDAKKQRKFSLPFAIPFGASLSAAAMRGIVVLAVAVFTVVMLYPSCQNYYMETRQLQQLEAEYEVLNGYNQQMQSQIDYLNTDQGLEEYARSELGWVREGEHVVNVEGVQATQNNTSSDTERANYSQLSNDVHAPDTWYSGILDVLFGYKS